VNTKQQNTINDFLKKNDMEKEDHAIHNEDDPTLTGRRIEKLVRLHRSSIVLKNHLTDTNPFMALAKIKLSPKFHLPCSLKCTKIGNPIS